jgi:gamma-glutamylaminecyclotransferase
MSDEIRLFAYGSLLPGERDQHLLAGAKLVGPMKTAPRYKLVDLGVFPALIDGGTVSVTGELYVIDKKQRFVIDTVKQCPILFQREVISLEDGTSAEAYVMNEDQVRGKRRIAAGDWRQRFAPKPRAERGGPLVTWAKNRF